jgi:hypothetical protein
MVQPGQVLIYPIEVAVVADGEVPHPAGAVLRSVSAGYGGVQAAGGSQETGGGECGGSGPSAGGRVPEQVLAGGVDDRGLVAASDGRSYLSVSWCRRTAVTGSALVRPVLTLVARTLSPALSWLMGITVPEASRTFVLAVKLWPQFSLTPESATTTLPERVPPSAIKLSLDLVIS